MDTFIGKHAATKRLAKHEVEDFEDFCIKFLSTCNEGIKDGTYFTTATEVGQQVRNNENHLKSFCICIDGDQCLEDSDSCIPPEGIHRKLKHLNLNHFIYTSFSNLPPKQKWRLVVPVELAGSDQHKATVASIYKLLYDLGFDNLVAVKESFALSQLWYLPRSSNPNVFKSYSHFSGVDYKAQTEYPKDWGLVPTPSKNKHAIVVPKDGPKNSETFMTYEEMVENIELARHPIHDSINLFIYGAVKDNVPEWRIVKDLNRLARNWDLHADNDKLDGYKNDFSRLVSTAVKKFKLTPESDQSHWDDFDESPKIRHVFTEYPDQGGMMEELVQCCMDWMIFPNRQIAVTAARAVISTLGARTYTSESGKGIALTALITGRSTIGKSNIKKFFIWLMDNFQLANTSQDFLGDQYYTSVGNMVKDLNSKISLLSIRTESGQSDKSKAGDMARVMTYELEFSTESGVDGYISGGGQNDKIPPLYSPAVTTVRESVARIQSDADAMNQSTVAGVSGRRSLILIDPIKSKMNKNQLRKVPERIRKLIIELYRFASDERRKDCTQPMKPDLWVTVKYKNPEHMGKLQDTWLERENRAALDDDDYESTFYGRLYERVPSYAAMLAIADNPVEPEINNKHLEIAEQSLLAELNAHRHQEESGDLDDPLSKLISKIEQSMQGPMKGLINLYQPRLQEVGKKELMDGSVEWVPLSRKLRHYIRPLDRRDRDAFFRSLGMRLRAVNISMMGKDETMERYGHQRLTLRRL